MENYWVRNGKCKKNNIIDKHVIHTKLIQEANIPQKHMEIFLSGIRHFPLL